MLDIQKHSCHMGQIGNSIEKHGDKEHVTGFTLPISEFKLTDEEFDAFFAHPYASRALFNSKKDVKEPALPFIEPYKVASDFEGATVTLGLTGDREAEFTEAKIKDFTFWPDSGEVQCKFKLYIRPGIGKVNLQLQENQECDIKLTIQDAKVASKAKDKQQDLFTASDGTPPEKDPNYSKGSTLENGDGTTTKLRSGKEIDAEMKAKAAGKNGDKDFEAAATAQVAAFRRGRATKGKNGKAART